MAAGLKATGYDIFFELCGWWQGFASFAELPVPVGNAWRVATDAGNWARFLENMEAAAAVAGQAGPGKGWPDVVRHTHIMVVLFCVLACGEGETVLSCAAVGVMTWVF